VKQVFKARQTTMLAPRDIWAGLEEMFGIRNNGTNKPKLAALEGFVLAATGASNTRNYILLTD